jgi:hypothetical protein
VVQRLGETALKPVNPVSARYNLDFGAGFMEKGSRFQGALPAADDEDPLPAELLEFTVLGRV